MGKDNRGLRPYFKGVPLIIISQTHVSAQMTGSSLAARPANCVALAPSRDG